MDCPICLEVISGEAMTPGCSHWFCRGCLEKWRATEPHIDDWVFMLATDKCPVCRHYIQPEYQVLNDPAPAPAPGPAVVDVPEAVEEPPEDPEVLAIPVEAPEEIPVAVENLIEVQEAGELPVPPVEFICPDCGRRYRNRRSLRRHCLRWNHHLQSEEIPVAGELPVPPVEFVCPDCGRRYRNRRSLRRHCLQLNHRIPLIQRLHLQYHCQDCGTSFRSRRSLRRHCTQENHRF